MSRDNHSNSDTPGVEGQSGHSLRPVLLIDAAASESQADLRDLWQIFFRYRIMFLILIVVLVAVSAAYAFATKPVYRAEVLLAPAGDEMEGGGLSQLAGQFGGLASLAGLGSFGGVDDVRALAVLKSRAFAESFITDNNLLPVLFADDWDAEQGDWLVSDADDIPTLADAFEKFDRDIRRISKDRETGLVTLTIDWHNRVQAAAWANDIVGRLNDHLRTLAIAEANRSIEYLNTELEKSSVVGVRQAIYKIIEKQVESAMLANVNREYAFRVIDPAVIADEDKYVWPKKLVIVFSSFVLALVLGAFLSLVLHAYAGRNA